MNDACTTPPAPDTQLSARLAAYRARIEQVLDRALAQPEGGTERLQQAMRYSTLGAGKRLRPSLVYLTGESLGAPLTRLDAPAAAVELIHVYSLVHDDLPAMDDDDLRRGRPTCHRASMKARPFWWAMPCRRSPSPCSPPSRCRSPRRRRDWR